MGVLEKAVSRSDLSDNNGHTCIRGECARILQRRIQYNDNVLKPQLVQGKIPSAITNVKNSFDPMSFLSLGILLLFKTKTSPKTLWWQTMFQNIKYLKTRFTRIVGVFEIYENRKLFPTRKAKQTMNVLLLLKKYYFLTIRNIVLLLKRLFDFVSVIDFTFFYKF